ncbi:DUF7160 family protein [Halobellus rufus]
MSENPPAECPECGMLSVRVSRLPPWKHDKGEKWITRAECSECGEYVGWF